MATRNDAEDATNQHLLHERPSRGVLVSSYKNLSRSANRQPQSMGLQWPVREAISNFPFGGEPVAARTSSGDYYLGIRYIRANSKVSGSQ